MKDVKQLRAFFKERTLCLRIFSNIAHGRKNAYTCPMNTSKTKALLIGPAAPPDGNQGCPLYLSPVKAGFPSPAEDYVEETLNLHKYAVQNEAATFFLRASGDSMTGAGIFDGDLLVVDRSIPADHNRIVIAVLEGELTVKRLLRQNDRVFLAPANPEYPRFDITNREYVHVWGVVTFAMHKL